MTKEKINKSNLEWQKILSENEYRILREEGTERAFTNKLYNENREGNYYCKGCNTKLIVVVSAQFPLISAFKAFLRSDKPSCEVLN